MVTSSSDDSQNVQAIAELLVEQNIDHVLSTPVVLHQIFDLLEGTALPRLKVAITAGEACPLELVSGQRQRFAGLELYNEYGPTEAAVWATVWSAREPMGEQVPIGRPIQNMRAYIVDSALRPAPAGVGGELLLGGGGLARGYWGRPELTAERFIPDVFSGMAGARLYRTGDLARYRGDGQIEFVGRADSQVKVRGFRIELGEIEANLLNHPELAEVVVQVRPDTIGSQQVVAYYVAARREGTEPDAARLRAHLSERLPSYMLPSAYVRLESFPRTVNGKIDRKALPDPERGSYVGTDEYEAPVGELERALAQHWQSVLKVDRVGRRDNFFALGGHSLLVITLIERLRRELGAQLNVTELYQAPTVFELAARIGGRATAAHPVNLQQEATIDDAIRPRRRGRAGRAKAVLLTGCTGFVGRFLLSQLLEDTDATIYCLVRSPTARDAASRVRATLRTWELWSEQHDRRIVIVPGDLHAPRLGVDETTYEELTRTIDGIYHCATSMNHLETYAMARPVNVEGTRWLLRFATDGRSKLVNYISTLSVFSPHGQDGTRVVDERSSIDHEAHWSSHGYAASKWVGEKMILAASERGVPCNVFRLGLVWADTRLGRYDALQREYRMLKSCLLSGYGIQNYRYAMAPTPVDYVARSIVHLANRHVDGTGIFHISTFRQKIGGLFEECNRIAGSSLELLPFHDWVAKVEQLHREGRSLPAVPLVGGCSVTAEVSSRSARARGADARCRSIARRRVVSSSSRASRHQSGTMRCCRCASEACGRATRS